MRKLIKSAKIKTNKKVKEEAKFPYKGIFKINPKFFIQSFYKNKLKAPEIIIYLS